MAEPQLGENTVINDQRHSFRSNCLGCWRGPRQDRMRYFLLVAGNLLQSIVWKCIILVFTIVLLFGSPIQFLLVPMEVDDVFTALYIAALAVFVVDMILHMLAEQDYLGCDPFRKHRVQQFDRARMCNAGIGSFNMWCDILSTGALLYDIPYINKPQFEEESFVLLLNSDGLPSNQRIFNPAFPVEFQSLDALILICKTARVVRLIPSTKVVEISSQINFFWYIKRLNPLFYYKKVRDHWIAAQNKGVLEPKQGAHLTKRGGSALGLEMAALARARVLADERRKQVERGGFVSRLVERVKMHLRTVGILPNSTVELKQHVAAMKIQRAWRAHIARRMEARSIDGLESVSIEGAGSFKKRSMVTKQSVDRPRNNFSAAQQDVRAESQVGTAMAEVTGRWVATIIMIGLILTIFFSYHERDATKPSTMAVLHGQIVGTEIGEDRVQKALNAAVDSVIPTLHEYKVQTATQNMTFEFESSVSDLREREKLRIIVEGVRGRTEGVFANREAKQRESLVELLMTIFVLVVWFLGVTAFAGPVMTLVITPIERMVRLLGMLMVDPLGYQNNKRFKKFMLEGDALIKQSQWTKEVHKGMETDFLMSTILRIGSLMRVGFGSAGVEIIRHNLEKGQNKDMLILNSQGSTVSCIFLFCDIRQFTDATECLQEEVFVFTNRIAAVVHSICHAYGGSANKNVGDAFLVSWQLDNDSGGGPRFNRSPNTLLAKHNQADKALLSVVKICMALYYDDYYVQTIAEVPRLALLNKLKNRPGPIVQMGFGLHAGKAVQGAIGSQRKIDATYVSEAVERAEFLESSTKHYGLKMLMSDTFHRLLHSSNRRRCRKIDRIMFSNEDEDDDDIGIDHGDIMELFTYDMDIDALWRMKNGSKTHDGLESGNDNEKHSNGSIGRKGAKGRSSVTSLRGYVSKMDEFGGAAAKNEFGPSMLSTAKKASTYFDVDEDGTEPEELVLPTGPAVYNQNVWLQEDMRRIRHQYTSVVFETFNTGLTRYYARDWVGARQSFEAILKNFNDGPSEYFIKQMEKHDWKPPRGFRPYGRA